MDQGGARIIFSKERIGIDCKVVELKVIAVTQGKLPSEVAYRKYEIREGLAPKPVSHDHNAAIIPIIGIQPANLSGNPDDLEAYKAVFAHPLTSSVSSSPDLSDNFDNFFGEL